MQKLTNGLRTRQQLELSRTRVSAMSHREFNLSTSFPWGGVGVTLRAACLDAPREIWVTLQYRSGVKKFSSPLKRQESPRAAMHSSFFAKLHFAASAIDGAARRPSLLNLDPILFYALSSSHNLPPSRFFLLPLATEWRWEFRDLSFTTLLTYSTVSDDVLL